MTRTINVSLSSSSIKKAINSLKSYERELKKKTIMLVERLQEEGFVVADAIVSNVSHSYDLGTLDINTIKSNVSTKDNKITATLSIEGEDVLFIEFGTGIKYSAFEHPLIGDEFPYGPGTYPGKGHWDDPKGWWFKDDAGQKHHTYGNPALMPAYNAATTMEIRITTIAREVFSK